MSPAAAPRRLIVLRHGQTEHNAAGVWQGHLDTPLSDLGREQAQAAARELGTRDIALVAASDLRRAADTGHAVAEVLGVPLRLDARLREIHAGAWQGMTGEQVREEYPQDRDRMLRGEDFRRGGDGESIADVLERARPAVAEVLEQLAPGECGLLATHGVTGRAVVADLVGIPQQISWLALAGLGNCHWAELVESSSGWRIRTWNASAHDAPDPTS